MFFLGKVNEAIENSKARRLTHATQSKHLAFGFTFRSPSCLHTISGPSAGKRMGQNMPRSQICHVPADLRISGKEIFAFLSQGKKETGLLYMSISFTIQYVYKISDYFCFRTTQGSARGKSCAIVTRTTWWFRIKGATAHRDRRPWQNPATRTVSSGIQLVSQGSELNI